MSAGLQQFIASDSDTSRESREFSPSDGVNDRSSSVQRQPNPISAARAVLRPSSSLLESFRDASAAIAVGEYRGSVIRDKLIENMKGSLYTMGIAVKLMDLGIVCCRVRVCAAGCRGCFLAIRRGTD